jgi:hypothetical protein
VTRQALSDLVNGKAGISIDMAIRLSKAFDSSPETWLASRFRCSNELGQVRPSSSPVICFYRPKKAAALRITRRRDRLQDRAVKRRQIAKDVMVDFDLKKLTAPDFTASIRPGTPALM